ncbi:MAG: hypothetical protein KZQ99_09760 [Candidatus Thiodiazotropha sp. (ex Dulcina madagascariensis)]|nr:hypothetical protein [Candidatus Thiodiazotropha sp. (ex Dulcina madagascariensis)]
MSLLTAEEITNLYLYGTTTTPCDLASDNYIRPVQNAETLTSVNVNEYMDTGPGRFASPALFEIIQLFFTSTAAANLAPGTYSEEELRPLLGTNQAIIEQQQWLYLDEHDDYTERVYIWNSVAYEIDESVTDFVVAQNGGRYIENISIIPFSSAGGVENFDLKSDDWLANLGNDLFLRERIDPSGIGRLVNIEFEGNRNTRRYEYADYLNDVENLVEETIPNPITLYNEIIALTDRLFANGTIRFLEDEKPILYGSGGDDTIAGTDHPVTEVDFSDHRYLDDYVANGMHYLAGNGNDTVRATDNNDVLEGGNGIDALYGNTGEMNCAVEKGMMRAFTMPGCSAAAATMPCMATPGMTPSTAVRIVICWLAVRGRTR